MNGIGQMVVLGQRRFVSRRHPTGLNTVESSLNTSAIADISKGSNYRNESNDSNDQEVLHIMKRQKRNQPERAFNRGYQAGADGRSRNLCPHDTGETRQNWLNGWREGREDHWNGYNRCAQAHKITNL